MAGYMNPSVNADYTRDDYYYSVYPPPPGDQPPNFGCDKGNSYETLPADYPWRKTLLGPASLKQLYRGPLYYPPQKMIVPYNTLYGDEDFSLKGKYGERLSYGRMMYPYKHRHPREWHNYSENILPYPAIEYWTKYKTLSEGSWGR